MPSSTSNLHILKYIDLITAACLLSQCKPYKPTDNITQIASCHIWASGIGHRASDTLGIKIIILISEVSLFQEENNMYLYEVGSGQVS